MEWFKSKFENVAEIVTGNTPPRNQPENYGVGIPWVKPPDLDNGNYILRTTEELSKTGQRKARVIPSGSVMVSCIGIVGKVGIAGKPLATNQQINSLIFNEKIINSKYGYYYCMYIAEEIELKARQAVVPILNKSNFGKIQIKFPANSEQKRIVEILEQADTLRKKRAEAKKITERIIPALFYKMFGDPVRNTFNWSVKKISDVAEINPKFDNEIDNNEFVSFIPMSDINDTWGKITGVQRKNIEEVIKGYTPFKDNDVLFAKITPCMENGKAAIARNLYNGYGFGSTEYHVIRTGDQILPEYIFTLVRLPIFRNMAVSNFTGTVGQQRVPQYFIADFVIPIPPMINQQRFANALNEIYLFVEKMQISQSKLETLFNLLLYKAFSGELTAKWRESHMEELLREMEIQSQYLNEAKI